jgi:NAD(P)-dependent dehydrogenase (short-subunit alcohol dehydrogenase family)
VRVNAVAPGLIETEILDVVAEDKQQALVDATPLGRIGTPEDVAELVLYLLSDRSSFVTGQTMVVCGGRAMVP